MDDLVQWLGEQLDEDERIAEEAGGRRAEWRLARPLDDAELGDASWLRPRELKHAERHDPARVLREIAAKRLLIRELLEYEAQNDRDRGCGHSADDFASGVPHKAMEIIGLRLIASVYSDRPGYREEWRP